MIIEIDLKKLTSRAKPPLRCSGPEAAVVDRGSEAQLEMESLVTGLLLWPSIFPAADQSGPAREGLPIPEVPTLPTTLEQARRCRDRILSKLEDIDFKELGANLKQPSKVSIAP